MIFVNQKSRKENVLLSHGLTRWPLTNEVRVRSLATACETVCGHQVNAIHGDDDSLVSIAYSAE